MKAIVADSSFYICFLDDIKRPCSLHRILNVFDFYIGRIIASEIKKSSNKKMIMTWLNSDVVKLLEIEDENYGELLRPFFSQSEVTKGEHEAVAIAVILHLENSLLRVIIDDKAARNFLKNNFPDLSVKLRGTCGFIKDCHCVHKILTKNETKEILINIKNSNFRIKDELVDSLIEQVEAC